MTREEPQFFSVYNQPWRTERGDHEVVHGLEARLVSKDSRTNAATYLARVPGGSTRILQLDEATVEAFVMSGDLSINGERVGVGGCLGIAQTCGPAALSSHGGAVAYFFVNPDLPLPAYSAGITAIRTWKESWIPAEMTGARHGQMYRSLRTPDPGSGAIHGGPGGMLRMTFMGPGFIEPRNEVHHQCWEEIIVLSGDLLMKDRGLHAAGTYLGNPANLWHYPAASQRGCLMLIQTDAPQDVEFRNVDGGYPLLEAYLDGASLLETPAHRPWENPGELCFWTAETAAGIAGTTTASSRVGNSVGLSKAPQLDLE